MKLISHISPILYHFVVAYTLVIAATKTEQRLIEDLLKDYNTNVRPVNREDEVMDVAVLLNYMQIQNMV